MQKLIYKASSRGEIRRMRNYQKLLTKSYHPRVLREFRKKMSDKS
ncbi:MAG: reverse transcriptase N-terminal domain-containing protein [Trichodesmium sp. MAG_R04]|nr:reverse transcriptase N-terminal domain-containing protein [Trichodesmium sp. MAG_R04]